MFAGDVGLAESAAEGEVHPAVGLGAVGGDVVDGPAEAAGLVAFGKGGADGAGGSASGAGAAACAPGEDVVAVGSCVGGQGEVDDDGGEAMGDAMNNRLVSARNRVEMLREFIESSNPKAILARGYSVVTDNSGKIIRSTDELSEGLGVNIETGNGTAEAVITGIKKGEEYP